MSGYVYFMERNLHGAWVVYGALGIRQYYYMNKKRAKEEYEKLCKEKLFYAQ